jgi:hypothetical protein
VNTAVVNFVGSFTCTVFLPLVTDAGYFIEQVGIVVMIETCIWEMLGLDHGQDKRAPD